VAKSTRIGFAGGSPSFAGQRIKRFAALQPRNAV
jgi:hypothetical protein